MSGWDWIHAGLEIATYANAQRAQQHLSEMKTASEIEAARRMLLEAMRNFVFDISRDIQLAEEHIKEFPQQVYIVSKSLGWRLNDSGLSPQLFPEFQDKEYFFQTQRKIAEVVEQSKGRLTVPQIKESDIAVQYLIELPFLQKALGAKLAQGYLDATSQQWRILTSREQRKNLFRVLGILGLVAMACISLPLLLMSLTFLGSGDFGGIIGGLLTLGIAVSIPAGSIFMLVQGGKSNPEFASLKAQREAWQKQLVSKEDWKQIISIFGDLTSGQFQKIYDERLTYLNPLLGGDFQKYLVE